MKDLILVESPTKAKTLFKFLKGTYEIEASMGHIRDLPKGKLGIDIENGFEPQYVIPKDKSKTVAKLRALAKKADTIILATDPDREGEAISFHLYEILKKEVKKSTLFKRITFHEITQEAINAALKEPGEINSNLVSAQVARRILDRIVGYKLSPLLWKKIKRNLSAGRVQSIALRLIVEREKEIGAFNAEDYFRIFVSFNKTGTTPEFELVKINEEKIETSQKVTLYDGEYNYKKTLLDKNRAKEILSHLISLTYTISDIIKKESKRSPYPPFITSTLQIDSSRRLGFPSKKTMNLAQKLYEEGFITYHRTDSLNLSSQFLTQARTFIRSQFGEKYLQERTFQTKSKVAQEAHEAIRPTSIKDIDALKITIEQILGRDAMRVYELIFKRALATQMADARFESTKVIVNGHSERSLEFSSGMKNTQQTNYLFEKLGSILLFDGFLKMWYFEENDNLLPEFTAHETLTYVNGRITNHATTPPPRYNEASLISTLEKNSIGRPSTYASIVSTIQERNYVERVENKFQPTSIGNIVTEFLVKNFEKIDDIPFTATIEDLLDQIANGEKEWKPVIKEFYTPFAEELAKAEGLEKVEVKKELTGEKCPKDGGDIIIRWGKFGKFKACDNFPDCDYKGALVAETEYNCPKDTGKVVMKKTRKGKPFFGCSNYPNCNFAVWNKIQLLKELGTPNLTSSSSNAKD